MNHVRVLFALLVASITLLFAPDAAANYSFRIPELTLRVDVKPDASIDLHYTIVFTNTGQQIDIVDIGMPNTEYDLGQVRAKVDGVPVRNGIADSSYIEGGVEVPLGAQTIRLAATATFEFTATARDMVFADTTDQALASLRITPTWFDASLVSGMSTITVEIWLPPGVEDGPQVLHQGKPFSRRRVQDGRTVVSWTERALPTGPMEVGVSFPRAAMQRVVVITTWDLFYAWWLGAPGARVVTFVLQTIVFGVFFFRFSAGTGWSLFIAGAAAVGLVCALYPTAHLASVPVLLALGVLLEVRLRRARRSYLPPVISIEGGGIKRGLTAPEAAALLERPLAEVLTLVVFGLLKKGLVELRSGEFTEVRTSAALRGASKAERTKHAGHLGVVIHDYEYTFLDAFAEAHAADEARLSAAMDGLLEHTATRVAGYDVAETRTYYRQVVERAWKEAEGIGPIERRDAHVDGKLEWLWLADDAAERFGDGTLLRGYSPPWSRTTTSVSLPGGGGAGDGGGSQLGSPSFRDVAASVVGWAENTAGGVASELMPKGGIDLGKIDSSVVAALEAAAQNSGSGGGGGGGCACACAGCACACACAGGGR